MAFGFSSAAIRAASAGELREQFEAALAPLKLGKQLPKQTGQSMMHFWCATPPSLDAWEIATGSMEQISAVFQRSEERAAEALGRDILTEMEKPTDGLRSLSMKLYSDSAVVVHSSQIKNVTELTLRPSPVFETWPSDLVEFAESDASVKIRPMPKKSGPAGKLDWKSVSLSSGILQENFSPDRMMYIVFEALSPEIPAPLAQALAARLASGVDRTYVMFQFELGHYHSAIDGVLGRFEGFTGSSFFGMYKPGFDVYQRPIEADQRIVRYPLHLKELSSGGWLQVDVVHRPQGDCLYDIQTADPVEDSKMARQLQQALKKLEVPYEVWEGAPQGRWK